MRHAFARFCPPVFLLLISLFGMQAVSAADDQIATNSQSVAYAYVGSSAPAQQDYSQGFITGFAIAPDGSAQAIPAFRVFGGISGLTSASGFIFGIGRLGTTVQTYTPQSDGSLRATSSVDVIDDYDSHNDEYVSALNPDRTGGMLNVGAVWPNSDFLPFAIQSDGSLALEGTITSGCGKSQAQLTFSPDNRWSYDQCSYSVSMYQRQGNGVLDGPLDFHLDPPPGVLGSGACVPAFLGSSALGYMAVVWNGNAFACNTHYGNLLAAYTVGPDGNLTLVPGSVLVPRIWEANIAFDPSGRYLALAGYIGYPNPQAAAIQVFKVGADGKFQALGSPVIVPEIQKFQQVEWDKSGHLYTAPSCAQQTCSTQKLYIFNVGENGVTPAPGSPHAVPYLQSLAVLPAK